MRAASRTRDDPETDREPGRRAGPRFAGAFVRAARFAGGRLAGAFRFEAFAAGFALVVATKPR